MHRAEPTYDSVGQAGEVVKKDGRSLLPHLVDQVNGDGLEGTIAGVQIEPVVLLRF